MKKVMLINVLQQEETRIAILEDGILEELYVERVSNESYVGNIYKGRVVNIEPSIQAAFIDFGVGRNGFLHISDVDPQYFNGPKGVEILGGSPEPDRNDRGGRGGRGGDRGGRSDRPARDRGESQDRGERGSRGSGSQDRGGETQERGRGRGRGESQDRGRGGESQDRGRSESQDRGRGESQERGRGDRSGRGQRGRRDQERSEGESRRDRGGRRDAPADTSHRWPEDESAFAEPEHLRESFEEFGGGIERATGGEVDEATDRGPGGEDKRDEDRRGPRRRGRRGRGRRKREAALDSDIPEELITDSDSLPDLEDFNIEEDETAKLDLGEPRHRRGGREERRTPPEAAAREEAPPTPAPEPPDAEAPPEEEFGFGEGLLDDDESITFAPLERHPPRIEPQRGYYRRVDDNDDDDSPFGSGIFEDEISEPPTEIQRSPLHAEPIPEVADDADLSFSDDDDDESIGPEPRVERYEDEDSPLESWAELAHGEPEESRPAVEESAAPGAGELEEGERGRRRRRRGGRGRRGRNKEEAPAAEVEAPYESEIVDSEEDLDEDEFGPRDIIEARETVESSRDSRDRDDRRPRRGGDQRRGGRQQGRNGARGNGSGGARRPRQRPPIQDIFKRGQEVLVQVIKEGIGNKGPTLSTYISIPGRYLVLMPGLNRVGVSRKIIDEEQRKRLREVVADLERPKGVGFIIRTAGLERTKKDLERDLAYLCRLWEVVVRRIRNQKSPTTIYQESDMIIRTIRDIFTSEIDTIYIDEPSAYERAREFLQFVMPKYVDRLKLYDKSEPLFHHYGIEDEISRIQQRAVPLPHGGSIVIDQTEAMVAIDVNSGNFRADGNAEETAFQINMTAAREIARQLRLRDLGGVIVNDFIDMREERHRRSVENALRDAVRRDRARTKILRMSAFGLVEMTRQRIRPSLRRSLYRECAVCHGTGHIKTVESVSIDCMRLLAYVGQRGDIRRIQLSIHPEIATYMQNHKRQDLAAIEQKWNLTLNIIAKDTRSPEDITLLCWDANGDPVHLDLGLSSAEDR